MATTTTTVNDGDILTRNGNRYRVDLPRDDNHGEPWKDYDGHGIVSDWTTRPKTPGEWVLASDGRSRRYYDVRATLALARRDHWGMPSGQSAEGLTARQIAVLAVEADYQYLRRWCQDDWCYIGVVVTLLDDNGRKTDHTASLWGIESDSGAYLADVVEDLIHEIGTVERCPTCGRIKP